MINNVLAHSVYDSFNFQRKLVILSMCLKNVANLDLELETLVKVGERITAQIQSQAKVTAVWLFRGVIE